MDTQSRFPHEQQAIDKIIAVLGQHVEFIQNYFLYDPNTNQYLECDLIAVSKDRIAIVELKHWAGNIDVRSYNWLVNGKYRKDPHIANKYKCQVLKGFYEKAFPFLRRIWIESIVILTNPDAEVQHAHSYKTDQHNPTFDSLDTFIKHYKSRSGITELMKLEAGDVKKIASKLRSQAEGPTIKTLSIPGYEILENLTYTKSKIEVLVRQRGLDLQRVKRLRIFPINVTASAEERKEQHNKALNSLKALERIKEHPNVIRVWSVPHEDGHVIEASDWSDEGTLADVIREQAPVSVEKAVTIVRGIVEGLRAIHQEGIVHRALSPENILMLGDIPKLMNFELSYIPEDNRVTVLPEAGSLGKSAYLAPELYGKQDYIEATDLFSVGVILYELLVGETPFPFSIYLKASKGVLKDDAVLRFKEKDIPEELQTLLYMLIQEDRNERPQEAEQVLKMLEDIVPSKPKIEPRPPSNRQLEAGESHGVYQIVEFLGKGSEAQIYRAKQGPDWEVALKLFNYERPNNRIYAERKALQRVQSPFIVRCQSFEQWSDSRLFLVFDLIHGESLRQHIDAEKQPDIETFRCVSRSLLEALIAMHSTVEYDAPLLHNDLKPDNILLKANTDPVIIDFGTASEPHLGPYMGTPAYAAPDLSTGVDFQFCESGELFALGITLFEWLCGKRPYSDTPSLGERPVSITKYCQDISEQLAQWLDQSVQPLKENRFENIRQMKDAFEAACGLKTLEESQKAVSSEESIRQEETSSRLAVYVSEAAEGNPFVIYLNSLHNTTAANDNALAESQALHPLFGSIHISLELTDYIEQQLRKKSGNHVILTGHAGDGKSTIGLELYKRLKHLPMIKKLESPLERIERISCDDGQIISLVKDMSELSGEERTETLQTAIQSDDAQRWFIISNTGTLLNSLKTVAEQRNEVNWLDLENQLLTLLEQRDPGELDIEGGRFTLINLARIDNVYIAGKLLEKFLSHEHWQFCEGCNIHAECPIFCNVTALQTQKGIATKRIEMLYRRLFEYGHRLTVRQMSAHLAYSLTAGLNYHDVREMASQAAPPRREEYLFFNNVFGFSGPKENATATRLTAVQILLPLELGAKPYSPFERRLWMKESGILPDIPEVLHPVLDDLVQRTQGGSYDETVSSSRMRQQIRRMFYLFGDFPDELDGFLPNFLESRMVQEVEIWQMPGKAPAALRLNAIKNQVLHVLQEQYAGIRMPEQHDNHELFITMKRGNDDIRQSVQIILAKIPLSHFTLEMRPINYQFKPLRSVLTLIEKYSQASLPLDVPFLDFVLMRNLGEIGQQLNRAYVDRLERFKAVLLDSGKYTLEALELLELTDDGRFNTRQLIFDHNMLQVL